jgi:hypothetical protein
MELVIKKVCSTCKVEKEITEFSKDRTEKDGYTYSCKVCRNKRYNEWAKENKDKVRERNAKKSESRQAYYQSERGIESSRRAHLKRKYNMTLEEYDVILESQNGVCDICKEPESYGRASFLAVDHCHNDETIRGLLCNNCNRAIGLLKDNIEVLENAVKYLKKHKQK